MASAVAISACGGSDPDPTNPSGGAAAQAPSSSSLSVASPPVATTQTPVSIAVYGDDSMMGITGYNNGMSPIITPNTEPADTQAALRAQFSDSAIVVHNYASGGTAAMLVNMIAGDDGGGLPYAQRVVGIDAQIVLDAHAINDDLEQSLGPYEDALIAFINDTRAAGKIPVLEEPGPVCDSNHPNLQNYAAAIDAVAQSYGVPLVTQYNEIQQIPNWQSHMSQCLYPDDYILAQKSIRQAAVLATLVKPLTTP
jgi:hypothetical protein